MAWFEAHSAHEFEQLATQLGAHGAPSRLVQRARRAADEERGHARIAQRRAGRDVTVEATAFSARSLEELAHENFLGGCINECASAVRSAYQADALGGDDLRALAEEEMGHAEFSWELHEWLVSSLDATQRRALGFAAEQKLLELGRAHDGLEVDVRDETGRPSPERWRAQLVALEVSVWRPAIDALLQ